MVVGCDVIIFLSDGSWISDKFDLFILNIYAFVLVIVLGRWKLTLTKWIESHFSEFVLRSTSHQMIARDRWAWGLEKAKWKGNGDWVECRSWVLKKLERDVYRTVSECDHKSRLGKCLHCLSARLHCLSAHLHCLSEHLYCLSARLHCLRGIVEVA